MGKTKIPTLIGILFLVAGLFVGVFFLQSRQLFRLGANEDVSPKDVRISNITDNSVTVTWITQKETFGFLKWGKSGNTYNAILPQTKEVSQIHSITVEKLEEETTYMFKINSNGLDFDSNNTPWQIQTAKATHNPNKAVVASGIILSQQGLPVKGALIYITVGGSSLQSTLSQDNGNWFITISNARNQTLEDFVNIDEENTLLEIFVQAGQKGEAIAQVYPASANPTPPIQLGKTHNFKTIKKEEEVIPEVFLEFGELTKSINNDQSVSLTRPSENEIFLTSLFEIKGFASENRTITLKIDPGNVQEEIAANKNSEWSWTSAKRLPNGYYELTISWKNNQQELNQIRRNFVVKTAQ